MIVMIGRLICKVALVTGSRHLYFASRNSFRSNEATAFNTFWRMWYHI